MARNFALVEAPKPSFADCSCHNVCLVLIGMEGCPSYGLDEQEL